MRDVRGVVLALLLLAWPGQQAAAADDCAEGKLRPPTVAENGTLRLRWIGTVNAKMASAIDAAFEAQKRRARAVELSLQSCGGRIDYMAATIGVLRNIKATHQLSTVVEPGATCASACIPIFLASDRRRAAKSSLWFFHRSWRHQLSGAVDTVMTAAPGKYSVEHFLEQYYAPAGVSRSWLSRLREIIERNDGYWQTGADLWEEKSGIITETIGNIQPQGGRPIYLAPAPGCTAMCRG
jgi:ATP-dependent protease ClpP protease subunit